MRHLLAGAAGIAGGALAAACGVGGSSTGGQDAAQSSRALDRGVKDELIWLIWSSNTGVRGEAYAAMTASFTERLPNVTATPTPAS